MDNPAKDGKAKPEEPQQALRPNAWCRRIYFIPFSCYCSLSAIAHTFLGFGIRNIEL
jgi:hypothetical protein